MCDEIESDMNEQNPEIFDQYRRADETGKREIEAKLKTLKTVARQRAKGVWYVWRENLISNVLVPLNANLEKLKAEAAKAEALAAELKPKYEAVKLEHDTLQAEVDQLLKEKAEYEAYDHETADALIAEIAELEAANAAMEEELRIAKAEDVAEKERMAVLEAERADQEAKAAEHAKMHPKTYTASEVAEIELRMKQSAEQSGLELVKVTDVITFKLLKTLLIHIKDDITFTLLKESPVLSYMASRMTFSGSTKESLAAIKAQWIQALELQDQLDTLTKLHPTTTSINSDDNLDIELSLLLPSSRTKLKIIITMQPDFEISTSVTRIYGSLDATRIKTLLDSQLPRIADFLPRLERQ